MQTNSRWVNDVKVCDVMDRADIAEDRAQWWACLGPIGCGGTS